MNKKRLQRGYSLLATMGFIFTFSLLGAATLSLTMTHDANAKRTADKLQANALAESAANSLFETIRQGMLNTQSYPFTLASTSLASNCGSSDDIIGAYSAKVLNVQDVQTDLTYGTTKIRRHNYTFFIQGTGTATNGVTSIVQAKFQAVMDFGLAQQSTGSGASTVPNAFSFPVAAMAANNNVNMITHSGISTTAPDGLSGHIIANNGMSWDTPASDKGNTTTPNILNIQGQYLVPGGRTYDLTVGPSGIGNPNGSVNYSNPAAPAAGSFPGAPANTVLQMPGPVTFADSATVDDWAATWYGQASQTGATTYSSALSSSSIPPRSGDGFQIIQAPAVIDGDLTIEAADTLRLMPYSTNPADNVIYVRGNVSNLGKLLNLGCKLVFEGKYTDSPTSDYTVDTNGSPFNGYYQVMERAALLSVYDGPDAFTFNTNNSDATGMVYACKGGIKVRGANAEFTGMLLAGGTAANGDIDIHPGDGSGFTLHFEPYAATGGVLGLDEGSVIDTTWVPVGVVNDFNPSKLSHFNQIK